MFYFEGSGGGETLNVKYKGPNISLQELALLVRTRVSSLMIR